MAIELPFGKLGLSQRFLDIRKFIASNSPFFGVESPDERLKRLRRCEVDLQFFAETYFPHYLTAPASRMHHRMYNIFHSAICGGLSQKIALAAPRGNAKSTSASLIFPIWCIVHNLKRYIVLISDTSDQSNEFLEFIKTELVKNERLALDYPKAFGKGKTWKTGYAITANGIKIRCWGSGKSLRGARHGSSRPDLVICDDLENDKNSNSPEMRRKLDNWFVKAVLKLGSPKTLYVVVGTILHYDSLLAKLLIHPGWLGCKFKAVMQYSISPLWQKWEKLFSVCLGDLITSDASFSFHNLPPNPSDSFYNEHKDQMLAGTEVLWPEVEDYHYLMKMRVSDGPAAFDSEKQNEPINPADCLFQEQWFRYWDDGDGVDFDAIPSPGGIWCAVDPSMGKKSNRADPSAIIIGAVRLSGQIDILEADIKKRHPDEIMETLFELHLKYCFKAIVIEEVQFQELFKDNILKEGAKRGQYLPIQGTRSQIDKILRIMKLQPHIKNGLIRFSRSQKALIEQLKYFPKASHDDGPDALEMLFSLIQRGRQSPSIRIVDNPKPIVTGFDDSGVLRNV